MGIYHRNMLEEYVVGICMRFMLWKYMRGILSHNISGQYV